MNVGYGSKKKNKAIERSVLLVDTVYDLGMLFVAYKYEWGFGLMCLILSGLVMCWMVHLTTTFVGTK